MVFWNCCCARAEKTEGQAGELGRQANGAGFPLTVVNLFPLSLRHSVRFEK